MAAAQPVEVHVVENVYVVNQYRLVGVEQCLRLLQGATRLEQLLRLVRYTDVDTEVVVCGQVVHNLLCKVVDVHHDALIASRPQLHHHVPEQGLSPHPDQRLGHTVGQRFQTGSQSRR